MAAAAAVGMRKRCAMPFVADDSPAPPHAKHGRFSPWAGTPPQLAAFDPLQALRLIFPDAGPGEIEACFDASGREVHATVQAYRARQRQGRAREAAAPLITRAAVRANGGGGVEECAGLLVEQMSAAADLADATSLASWVMELFTDGVAKPLREEIAALKAQAAAAEEERAKGSPIEDPVAKLLREENAALKAHAVAVERDNGVLKRGVQLQHRQKQEMERAAAALLDENAALKKKVAELEMANYALRLRDTSSCSLQALRGPHVF